MTGSGEMRPTRRAEGGNHGSPTPLPPPGVNEGEDGRRLARFGVMQPGTDDGGSRGSIGRPTMTAAVPGPGNGRWVVAHCGARPGAQSGL